MHCCTCTDTSNIFSISCSFEKKTSKNIGLTSLSTRKMLVPPLFQFDLRFAGFFKHFPLFPAEFLRRPKESYSTYR